MTKQEFFDYLNKRLEILDKKEREDILAEFDQHINNKIENGCTEAEAIADFGDPEEFVEEILEAYKVNPEYNQPENNGKNTIGRFLKNFGNAVNAIADSFFQKSKRELLAIIMKLIVLCLVLWLIRVPLDMLIQSATSVFTALPDIVYQSVYSIINFIFNLAYLLMVCYTLYLFVVKSFLADQGYRAFDPSDIKIPNNKNKSQGKEKCSVNEEKRDSSEFNSTEFETAENNTGNLNEISDRSILSDIKAKGYKFRKENQEQKTHPKNNNEGALINLIGICLKILVVFCMLPVIVYALCNFVGLGASFIMMCSGLPLIGITIAALGSLLCVCVFIIFVFKLIFADKKQKNED
ncbi:MAG: HAAS signaling domain-containing protein [Bacillota bacterium]|jgi:uncharacterized membrane protein